MRKKLLVIGRGPSWERVKEVPDDYETVLFINMPQLFNYSNRDEELLNRLRSKKVVMYTNMPQRLVAFQENVLNFFNVDECAISRCSPNWPLWRQHKEKQRRVCPAWKQLPWLPALEEDEPYPYIWRGPEPTNAPNMFTPNGKKINHLADAAEPYLASIYGDRMMCNCSIYASLYAILNLRSDHIYYCGLDFYHDLKVAKESYFEAPKYMSGQNWWQVRVKTEGEHTKVVYDEYMTKFFPNVTYEFYTDANWNPTNKNVITHCSNKEIVFKKYDSNYYTQ